MPTIAWNSELYDQKHGFVSAYGKGVIELLEPQAGERILDLGCGTGQLARSIADSGAHVVGLDSSAAMIETARQRYPELEFVVADARSFTFAEPFDAIFSNAALHWIKEAERVVQAMSQALKRGGRLVLEMGGKGNVEAIVGAVQQAAREVGVGEIDSGWYYPSIGEYTTLLERNGLEAHYAILFARPTRLEDGEQGLRTWLQMFGNHMLAQIPAEQREQVLALTEEKLRSSLFQDEAWFADYRRLRVVAYKQ